jgi:HK97 family phage prohead protease
MLRFTSDQITIKAEAGEEGERRIDAIAVPYNVFASVSDGQEVMFLPGSLPVEGKAPRVFMYHDPSKPVGIVAERLDTEDGMIASMKISRTALGDEALTLAADGVMDVSVGVNVISAKADQQGRLVISKADWLELSLVPIPAFAGATVLDVAAEAALPDETESTEPVEETTVEATPEAAQPVEAAATPTALFAQPRREFRMPSAAEYIASFARGGADHAQLNANIRAAAGDEILTDVPGLLPTPVVAPIFDAINQLRPSVSALGPRSMPAAGKVFIRPKITTHTEVGNQGTELTGLDARTMVVDDVQVTKKTFGGQVTSLLYSSTDGIAWTLDQTEALASPTGVELQAADRRTGFVFSSAHYTNHRLPVPGSNENDVLELFDWGGDSITYPGSYAGGTAGTTAVATAGSGSGGLSVGQIYTTTNFTAGTAVAWPEA